MHAAAKVIIFVVKSFAVLSMCQRPDRHGHFDRSRSRDALSDPFFLRALTGICAGFLIK